MRSAYNRCPECGRSVSSFFQHVDTDCTEWPDRSEDDEDVIEYKGHTIEKQAGRRIHVFNPEKAGIGKVGLVADVLDVESAYRYIDGQVMP